MLMNLIISLSVYKYILSVFKFTRIFRTPRHMGGFQANRGTECAANWAAIPADTDILLTHGPPAGVGSPITDTLPTPRLTYRVWSPRKPLNVQLNEQLFR